MQDSKTWRVLADSYISLKHQFDQILEVIGKEGLNKKEVSEKILDRKLGVSMCEAIGNFKKALDDLLADLKQDAMN